MIRVIICIFLLYAISCTNDNEQDYFGCTDTTAVNYVVFANIDDGSCLFDEGCVDENACNYNALAIIDDGSCEYVDAIYYTSIDNNNIESIIKNKCNSCHSNYHLDNVPLNYQMLKEYSSILIDFMNGSADGYDYTIMPPPGSSPLTDCEKQEIIMWVNNDFKYEELR